MKLENQVCSLGLSKKLKELGVKQESLWYYRILAENPNGYRLVLDKPICKEDCRYSAFTVAELGEMLPEILDYKKSSFQLTIEKVFGSWIVKYGDSGVYSVERTEANARAKMLIYLIEKNLIEVK